jgi:uncharacterized membrane protein (UPF0127 family)
VTRRRSAGFLGPLLAASKPACLLRNERSDRVVAAHIVCAFDSRARRTGLLNRTSMADEAMVIAPTNAVHTWFMRFPIDIAFVAKDGTVLKTYEAVPPWRIAAWWRGYAAIELCAGALAASGTVAGDRLAAVERDSGRPGTAE